MTHFCYLELEELQPYGHHLNIIQSIMDDVRDTGLFHHFSFIGNNNIETSAHLERIAFDQIIPDIPRVHLPNEQNNILSVAHAMRSSILKVNSDKITLYSNMPSPYVLLAFVFAALQIPKEKTLKFIIRMAMTDEEWAWYETKLSSIINYISATRSLKHRFLFTVESKRLQEYYNEKTGYTFPIQLGPVSKALVLMTKNKWYDYNSHSSTFNFSFIGEAREEKGFQYLPTFIEQTSAIMPSARFFIQCNASEVNNTSVIIKTRNRLVQMSDAAEYVEKERIVLYQSPLPPAMYQAVLGKSHCIMLPYLKERYWCRGSGIAFEGIQANALVLVTGETDLEVTFDFCRGVIPFNFSSQELPHSISALVQILKKQAAGKTQQTNVDLEKCTDFLFPRIFYEKTSLATIPELYCTSSNTLAGNNPINKGVEVSSFEEHLYYVFEATKQDLRHAL